MTQVEEAEIAARNLIVLFESVLTPMDTAIKNLEDVLDKSQNSPPEGSSDGSISEAQWNELKSLTTSIRSSIKAITSKGVPGKSR